MPEMGVAPSTVHLRPCVEESIIGSQANILRVNRRVKAWPTGTRFILRTAREQVAITHNALVGPFFFVVPVLVPKGRFGRLVLSHVILNRSEESSSVPVSSLGTYASLPPSWSKRPDRPSLWLSSSAGPYRNQRPTNRWRIKAVNKNSHTMVVEFHDPGFLCELPSHFSIVSRGRRFRKSF